MLSIDQLGLPDEETLRILISTDNHVGYLERDPVRSMDSFAALEEVLYLAKKYNVSFGG
jgi:double-strand break repair protein MRE11